MAATSIQVHLPSFSHSFSVSVPSDSTILILKQEISRTCIGSPNTTGQRIIYKGRVLDDTEIVGQVWRATDEPHTCHLAVHPSAWTAAPPNIAPLVAPSPPLESLPGPSPNPQTRAPPVNGPPPAGMLPQVHPHVPLSYIQYLHTNALRILLRQPLLPWPEQMGDIDGARAFAKRAIEASGRGWPPALNQDFPIDVSEQGADEGVKYVSTYIDNLPYLSLVTPDATPTPIQSQAIRILGYTFPLLCVYAPSHAQHSNPLHVNAIPPRPLAPLGVHMRGAFHLPIRPLIVPLIFLTIRTTLLLYFFQPARKPLFGLMVLIWVIWEVAGAVRGAVGDNGDVNGRPNNRAENAGNPNAPAGGVGGQGAAAQARPRVNNNAAQQPATPSSQEAFLNHLAQLNLSTEARFVDPDSTPTPSSPPPSLAHKIKTFCVLFFLTLHPAIWDRRRTTLRAREGRVREEARTREARISQRDRERAEREENRRRGVESENSGDVATEAPEPLPPPKPYWVAEYVQRVRSGDWVDE